MAEGVEATRIDYQLPVVADANAGSDAGARAGPLIALVGEAPGREEVRQGRPFVGRSGLLLDESLAAAGIARAACLVANVFRYRPDDNRVEHFFASRGRARKEGFALAEQWGPFGTGQYCRAEYAGELEALAATLAGHQPAVVVALGRTPLWALTGLNGLMQCRGRTLDGRLYPQAPVVATVHPSFLLRGRLAERPAFVDDLRRARALAA